MYATRMKDVDKLMKGVKCVVGLRQQGHMETVAQMVTECRSWDEIGKAIGWDGNTAREWYIAEVTMERRSLQKAIQEVYRTACYACHNYANHPEASHNAKAVRLEDQDGAGRWVHGSESNRVGKIDCYASRYREMFRFTEVE